jgi:HTH-type transcriptional regulator / antitoxin HigA
MTLTFDKNAYGALLAEIQPQVITSEEENERYLEIVEELMACKNRTPEQNALLKLLVLLIEEFEDEHYPLTREGINSLPNS